MNVLPWWRQGTVWLLTVLFLDAISHHELVGGSPAYAETSVIPSIAVSEKFDTNIFNAAPQFIPAGTKQWDFMTTVAPGLLVTIPDRDVKTDLTMGASGNTFVNNPELSHIATNAGLNSNLDKLIGQLIPGTKLQVSDYFSYTPQPPAFLTGVQTSQGVPDIYARGLQIAFANSLSNTARAKGSYALSPTFSVIGEYSYSMFNVGEVFVTREPGASPVSGLTTVTHDWSAGSRLRLSKGDTLSLKYQNAETSFSGGGGPDQGFTTHTVRAEYSRVTPNWKAEVSVGPGVIEPGGLFFYSGRLTLSGKYDPATTATVTLSRETAPSLFGTLGALISNTAGVSVQHSLEKGVRLTGSVNYAYNESAPVKNTRYETLTGQLVLSYPLSRIITTTLTYDYSHFTFNSSLGGITNSFLVDKSALTLSFVFTWK